MTESSKPLKIKSLIAFYSQIEFQFQKTMFNFLTVLVLSAQLFNAYSIRKNSIIYLKDFNKFSTDQGINKCLISDDECLLSEANEVLKHHYNGNIVIFLNLPN